MSKDIEIPSLHFGPNYETNDIMLFEIKDEETLQKIIDGTIKMEIVSNLNDPLVICTNNKTFELVEFDTSNSLLVCNGPEIISKQKSTFELRHIKPPFLKFRQLLNRYPATEAEIFDQVSVSHPLSLSYLKENTLCSLEEFDQMMLKVSAFCIEDNVKVPTPELRLLIIDAILRYAQTQEQWRSLNIPDILKNIQIPRLEDAKYRDSVILAVLRSLSYEFSDDTVHLDESLILKHFGTEILKNAYNQKMSKQAFTDEMKGLIPIDMKISEELLYGIFVSDGNDYKYVDEETLPIEIDERFNRLFEIKREWHTHEIEPFFEYFISDDKSFSQLASLYARPVEDLWMPR